MEQSSIDALVAQAKAWAIGDPDDTTQRLLSRWVDARDEANLRPCFEPKLEFGTAGLRGLVGPGPAQMNIAVIRQVTAAVLKVVQTRSQGAISAPIVVGFDGRLDSRSFAHETVGVIAAMNIPVAYFEVPTPTPVVAFAALRLGAPASMVVTASHNPKEYNGFKVYGADGIQITPPFDVEVSAQLAVSRPASEIAVTPVAESGSGQHVRVLGEAMAEAYVESVISCRVPAATAGDVTVAYSPLHGVGAPYFERVFRVAGYRNVHTVPEQREVDGHFSTLGFPNPEEASTFERVLRLAEEVRADVVLVNDPDADRMGAALPQWGGGYRILTGNEIGIILTDYLLQHAAEPEKALVVSTLVSSPMTAHVAKTYGAQFEETLTGFKWLWTAARLLEQEHGLRCAICWEEALGYSTHRAVRDKDGISAALCLADWVSERKAKGERPLDRLGELYRCHGAWASAPLSLVRPGAQGLAEIRGMLQRLSEQPPSALLGRDLVSFVDYRRGASNRPVYRGASDVFVLELEGNARIVVRPSGTEPKLKLYVDLCEPVDSSESPWAALERAKSGATALGEALVERLR